MEIRMARNEDFERVMQFYYDLTDAMQNAEFRPGWEKDVYPTRAFIQQSIERGELAIGEMEGAVASAMVMNREGAEGYDTAPWQVHAAADEVAVIHALGILPRYQGKGIAKKMVAYTKLAGMEKGLKAIRLDVLASNIPAQKLYTGAGFVYIDTIKLFYEDTGLTDFLLYELPL